MLSLKQEVESYTLRGAAARLIGHPRLISADSGIVQIPIYGFARYSVYITVKNPGLPVEPRFLFNYLVRTCYVVGEQTVAHLLRELLIKYDTIAYNHILGCMQEFNQELDKTRLFGIPYIENEKYIIPIKVYADLEAPYDQVTIDANPLHMATFRSVFVSDLQNMLLAGIYYQGK